MEEKVTKHQYDAHNPAGVTDAGVQNGFIKVQINSSQTYRITNKRKHRVLEIGVCKGNIGIVERHILLTSTHGLAVASKKSIFTNCMYTTGATH